MDNNKESSKETLLDIGIAILGILFIAFFGIIALGLVVVFNYLFWDLTFWLAIHKHFIAVLFVGALSVCVTIASIVGIITFIVWLFTNKDD